MGVTGLWDILRPSGKLRSLTHLAVIDGFEGNPANLRGLRIGIDASIWFFHAAYGREGENPELRTLFFRCARLMSAPFLPLFIFDGPKRPKIKRGKRISGEKHWLVDSMKGIIEAFGMEWRMAPGEAEAELAHLNNIGVIDGILSDDVDNFLFGAKMVIRNPSINLTGNHKHATKNADGRVDGNHSTIYTSADILAHPSVQLTRGGLILIGLLSGGDYHPAGLSRCGTGTAQGLAKCGFGNELLEATQTLTRAELPEFLTKWREGLRKELRTNSRGHLGSKKPSLAKVILDSFPDIDVLLSYTNPITSATDAGARRTHTPPGWDREPDLSKIGHFCELHFEWGLKDIIIKRFRTVLWPSIVLRTLRRAALEKDTAVAKPLSMSVREQESHQDIFGTPSKVLARHFSSMGLRADDEDEDSILRDLIVKIHGSRMHAYTDGILEYRLEIAPAQLVRLASAGIQGLRKLADTTYDVLPSELDDSDEGDDESGRGGTNGRKKRRGGGPPPEPESHLRVWMPACMVRYALPDIVGQYETALEAKRAKKSKSKAPRNKARAAPVAKRKGKSAVPSKKAVEAPPVRADEEYFDLDVSSSEESDGRGSPLPSGNHLRPLPTPLPTAPPKKKNVAVVHGTDDVFANDMMAPNDGVRQHSAHLQENPQRILDIISGNDDSGDAIEHLKTPKHHLASPSKLLQSLDLNLHSGTNGNACNKAQPLVTPSTPSSSLPRALRPFPIAFEEEESSEGDRETPSTPPTSDGHNYVQHLGHATPPATPPASSPQLQWRSLAVAREEEEESSDDPDAVSAELPVLSHPPTRGQSRAPETGYTHKDVSAPASPENDTSGSRKRPPRQHSSSLSPSKARKKSPERLPQPLRCSAYAAATSTDDDDDDNDNELPDNRRWHVAETSVISISSDSDCEGGDVGEVGDAGDVGLSRVLAPVAPLLIARSRTTEQKRLVGGTTAAGYYRKAGVEPEVIDLT